VAEGTALLQGGRSEGKGQKWSNPVHRISTEACDGYQMTNSLGTRLRGVAALLALALVAAAWWGLSQDSDVVPRAFFPEYAVRYRISVAVRVDGQRVVASAVQEMVYRETPWPVPLVPSKVRTTLRGEATVLEMPGLGALVVLIGTRGYNAIPVQACNALWGADEKLASFVADLKAKLHHCSVPLDWWPTILATKNMASAEGMAVVAPSQLGEWFHNKVAIEEIWLEATSDEFPSAIDSQLPWLAAYSGGEHLRLQIPVIPSGRTMIVGVGNFRDDLGGRLDQAVFVSSQIVTGP